MRRIIHNTTALAACLSLLVSPVAMAQDALQDEPADPAMQDQTAGSDAAEPQEGVEPPATEESALTEADSPDAPVIGTPEDIPDQGAATPEESVDLDAFEEAPSELPPAAPSENPNSLHEAQAEYSAPREGDSPADDTAGMAEPEAAEPAQDPADSNESGADAVTGQPGDEEEAASEAPAAVADPVQSASPDDEGDLARALADEQDRQDAPEGETGVDDAANGADAGLTDQPADTASETPAGDAAAEQVESGTPEGEGDLARALAEEQARQDATEAETGMDAATTGAQTEAESEQVPEDADAATETPEEATEETPGADDLTGADSEVSEQDGQAADEAVAPEEGAQETEAAREAAEAAETPTAAALSDEAGEGEITEEVVTEENSRSSDEDFATSLRDALNVATGTATTTDDGDDDNDLARALLLGLGGLAVGSMLNNNREVTLSSPDRVVITRPDGSQQVIKDEVALLRQPGSTVTTENFADGSSRTIVARADGSQVVTIRDADLRVLRRTLVMADGSTVPLIDDTATVPVDIAQLPAPAEVVPRGSGQMDEDQLREALLRESSVDRGFTLGQIRNIPQVRALVPPVNIDAITFDTGSAAISPEQARQLSMLGNVIRDSITQNPREIFLIEGHTDTVGSDAMNLALSDRRAESVALALTEYFDVPAENMVVQGYGEQFLQVRREGDVRENRRASVRRITSLLQGTQ